MLSLTLILLLAVEAQKNRAPVCAIGLKKGARVRLPQGARKASPALQIRVRKQLPIPIRAFLGSVLSLSMATI